MMAAAAAAVAGAELLNYYRQRRAYARSLLDHLEDNEEEPKRLLHRDLSARAYKPPKAPIFNEPDWKPKRVRRRLTVCTHPELGTVTFYNGRPVCVRLERTRRLWVSRYTAPHRSSSVGSGAHSVLIESGDLFKHRGRFTLVEAPGLLTASPRSGNRAVRVLPHVATVEDASSSPSTPGGGSGAQWLPENEWLCVRTFGTDSVRAGASLTFLLYLMDARQVFLARGAEECAAALASHVGDYYLDCAADRPWVAEAFAVRTRAQRALDLAGMARDPRWSPPLLVFDGHPEPVVTVGLRQPVLDDPSLDGYISRRGVSIVFDDPSEYPVLARQVPERTDLSPSAIAASGASVSRKNPWVETFRQGRVAAYCEKAGIVLARRDGFKPSRLFYTLYMRPYKRPVVVAASNAAPSTPATPSAAANSNPVPVVPLDEQKLGRNLAVIDMPETVSVEWLRFLCGLVECVACQGPTVLYVGRLDNAAVDTVFGALCAAGTARGWVYMHDWLLTVVRDQALVASTVTTTPVMEAVPNSVRGLWGAFDKSAAAVDFTGLETSRVEVTLRHRALTEHPSEFPGARLPDGSLYQVDGDDLEWDPSESDPLDADVYQDFRETQRDADLLEYLEERGLGECLDRQRVVARQAFGPTSYRRRRLRIFDWIVRLDGGRLTANDGLDFFLPRPNVRALLHTEDVQTHPYRRTVTINRPEMVRVGIKVLNRVVNRPRHELLQITGPRTCFGPDDTARRKWIRVNGWLGGLSSIEWTPSYKTPLFYYETDRVTKRRTVERELNDYQRALLYGEDDRRHFFGDWVGLVCSMLELDPEIMMIWCRACCSKFHAFAPKRRGLDSSMTEGAPIPYVRRLDHSALRPFKADRDVSEAVDSCHGDSAKNPQWAVYPVACRTVPIRRTTGTSQKQHAHIVNTLVNEHGYAAGLPEYAYELMEAYEYLLVGAFVLTRLKRTTLSVLLLDVGQLAAAADEILNTSWYTVESPQYFLVKHHTASYGSRLECLVALARRSCAWVQCDKGSALIHTADSALTRPPDARDLERDSSTYVRVILSVLLALFEYTKLDEDVWRRVIEPLVPEDDPARRITTTYLHTVEDALTREAALLAERLWRDVPLTLSEIDVSYGLCDVFWRLFSVYVGAVASYKRVPACVAVNSTVWDAAVPDDNNSFTGLPRVSCSGMAFSIKNPWNDRRHLFAIVSDLSRGSDGVVHRHIVLDDLTTIYTPDLDREMAILPAVEDRLSVRWKESYRECAVSYFDRQRDRTCETFLPDCLPEFLQAAVLESDPYTLRWTVEPRAKPSTTDAGRVADLVSTPFRYQTVAVPGHPLHRPHLGVPLPGRQRSFAVQSKKVYRYQVEYEPADLKVSVRSRGARGRGDAASVHTAPLPPSVQEFPDELELRVTSAPEDPSVDRYLRAFAARVVYDAGACRHLFTTVFLRPLESLDATLDAMETALPRTKNHGGWLLVEFREPDPGAAAGAPVTICEWRDGTTGAGIIGGTGDDTKKNLREPFALTLSVSCKARCLKPALVNCLLEKWREVRPALTVIRLDCSGVASECIEAVLTVNLAELPTFRCVVIQHPDELTLDAQLFRNLPFVDDVRPLQPERELVSQVGVTKASQRRRDVRDVYVAVDQMHRKTDLVKEVSQFISGENIELHWTAFEPNYKLSADENYIVVYDLGNRWTLSRIRELLKKSPLARAIVCLRSKRDTPSYSDMEGRLLVNFFRESPVVYLSKWLRTEPATAPVSRLGPTTVSFESYPDYGDFFDSVRRVNSDERKLQVLAMPAATGGRYFFAVDAQAPQRCVFEHALIRDHLESSLTLSSAKDHGVDSARARALMDANPSRWGWRPVEKLLEKKASPAVSRVRWYGPCLDTFERSSWRQARTLPRLLAPYLTLIDDLYPDAHHTATSTSYPSSTRVSHPSLGGEEGTEAELERTVRTVIAVDHSGSVDAVVTVSFDEFPDELSVKMVGPDVADAPVFAKTHKELLFHCIVRLYAMGCVSVLFEYDDEEAADAMMDALVRALKRFESEVGSRLALAAVGGYLNPPTELLDSDRDNRSRDAFRRFEEAFEDRWGPGSVWFCRDTWRESLCGSVALTPVSIDLIRSHRDYKRQLLAFPSPPQ
ncbi:protein ORF42 [Cyprinid herpesvirus 3]|nr:protein ORF42 [Cyprinid herpesvirus 3]